MKIKHIANTLFLSLLLSLPAFALSLDAAKSQGLVGETPQGYIAAVSTNADSSVKQLVDSINTQRKAAYQESATKAGVATDIIAKRMAQRLYQRAESGEYLLQPDGRWTKQ
jgi:uncharacterized protein YdbL (DUF1318 family)